MRTDQTSRKSSRRRRLPAVLAACLLGLAQVQTALAQIVNDVVVTGGYGGKTIQAAATASVMVIPANSRITLLKTGVFNDGGDGRADVGDTIFYRFSIANAGNVSLSNVSVADPLVAVNGGPLTVLPPGTSDASTFTAVYQLTQADIDAGTVTNTATVTGSDPGGNPVTSLDDDTTALVSTPGITLSKQGKLNDGGDGRADAGDTILYQFVVTNTGPTTLNNIKITDPLLDLASRATTARDLAQIGIGNTATDFMATASTAQGLRPTILDTDAAPFAIAQPGVAERTTDLVHTMISLPPLNESLRGDRRLIQLSGSVGAPKSGDRVGILYAFSNTGDTPLYDLIVRAPGSETFADGLGNLAPGATDGGSVMFTRLLNDDDIAAGSLASHAVISAQSRGHTLLTALDAPLPLAGIEHADTLETAAISPAAVATLAPGASAQFSAVYTLTQSDIDSGTVHNTATASALDPGGATLVAVDTATVPLPPLPAIALVKTGTADLGPDSAASVGDLITYHFAVTNTGNVTLGNITLSDPLVTITGGPLASLAPGDSDAVTFTASYAITQVDINAGQVTNQATVTGQPPSGPPVTDISDDTDTTGSDPTITSLSPTSGVTLLKSVASVADLNGNGVTDAGDQIKYVFAVTNSGTVTLSNLSVSDPLALVTGGPLPSLAPGITDNTTFRATYLLTQADVDKGSVSNQATVSANDPAGVTIQDLSDPASPTGDAPTITPIPEAARLALVKTVSSVTDSNGNGVNDVGDVVHYSFAVTNSGNVTLTNVAVSDPLVQVAGGPLASLAPGAVDTTTFTASYIITDTDALAGRITNQATASATTPAGDTVNDLSDNASPDENDPTVTPVTVLPAIALLKTVDAIVNSNGNALTDAGDTIEYRFTVTNTGNVPLTTVTVTDPLVIVAGGPIATLDAGKSDTTTFTASYVITDADVAAGHVINQATAFGASPAAVVVSDVSDGEDNTQNDPTVTALANTPAIALVKSVSTISDTNGNGSTDAGDIINYVFAVTNTGNVALANVTVNDPKVTVTGGPLASLGVSQTDAITFHASYVITTADVDAGGVTNQATASGTTPGDVLVTDRSDDSSTSENDVTVTPISGTPGIALVKTVGSITDSNGNGQTDPGDILHYAFAVTNTGNQTLTGITVSDPKVTVTGGPLATLAPGAIDSTTFTASYTVTTADAAAGQVSNQAIVNASTPSDDTITDRSDDKTVSGDDPTVTPVAQNLPSLSKTALLSEVRRGERVPYVIVAANVTTGPLSIIDIMPPGFSYVSGSATANGSAVIPVISGRTLSFTDLSPNTALTITLKLSLRASTAAKGGRQVNRAELRDDATGVLLASAQAAVTIIEEHVFDCGEIIGRVFDDKNRNGYADDGEPGLPAVRVVTVKGLLVTTDKNGRFHVPCADIPDAETGSNFLMKLDTRTLPSGYTVTSENPRDVRLTRGKVTKLNFGASIMRLVMLDLKDDAFTRGRTALNPEWNQGIANLMKVLLQEPSVLKLTYQYDGSAGKLAVQRTAAVKALIADEWKRRSGGYRLVIDARAVSVE